MDYDDSDFQSQNFQLGGEDNKFPPGLQSYPHLKFDLDETLHLRFETEVLLGIQSQEENHWIEDFSRGSSGIEFSSSAAESCTISMRNNVWSEATSSESVEMLLKSVGDDEMVNKQHINEESRICDALNDSDNQMDLSLKQDDSLPSKIEDAIESDSTLLADKGLKSSSGSSEEAAGDLPMVEDVPQIEHDDNSGFENLSDLDPCSVSEKYETYVNITSDHCNLEKTIMLSSVQQSGQDDHGSAAHGMTTDSSDDISVECMQVDRVLNDQKIPQEETDGCSEVVFCEKSLGLLKNYDQTGEIEDFSKDVLMDGQHCEEPADRSTGEVESASGLARSVDFSLQRTEHGDDVLIEKPIELLKADSSAIGSGVLRKDNEMNDDSIGHSQDTSLILMEGKRHVEHELATSRDNENAHLSCSAATYTIHDAQEIVQINDGHIGHSSPNHSAEDSEFAAIGNKMGDKVSRTDKNNPDIHLTDSEPVIQEDAQCLHELPGIMSGKLHVSSSLTGEFSQSYKSSQLGDKPSDAHVESSDISIVDKGNGGLPTSPRNSEAKIDNFPILENSLETSSHGESAATMTVDVCGSQCEQVMEDSTVPTEDMSSISKLEENDQVMNEIAEQKAATSPVPILDCLVMDEKKESITSTSTEPCASAPDRPNPVSDPGQHLVCHSAAEAAELQARIGAAESSASMDESIHSLGQNELQMATGKCDKGLEELPAAHVSEMKELDGSEVSEVPSKEDDAKAINIAGVTLDCHGETSFKPLTSSEDIVDSHPGEAGSVNPTSDEPNCGSPIIISCSEPSESKKDYEDGGNEPSHQSFSISGDDTHIPADVQTHVSDVKSTIEDDRSFTFKVGSPADLSDRETERGWKPFSNAQPSVSSQTQEAPATTNLGNADPKVLQGASHGSHRVSDEQKVHVGTKATNENKTKAVSGSATGKKTNMQEKAHKKSQKKTIEKDCSPFNTSANLVGISRPLPAEELRHYSYVEGGSLKKSGAQAVQASNLPDLNSSALTMSHQPFTDVQQVQLRAQIFVYGSLIQGIPPDEACMISAFGDGGRSLWENVWRLAVERFQNQKSPLSNTESPFHSRSGIWTSEQPSKSTPLQGKAHSTPAGRTGNKGTPSTIVSSGMFLSSPVWNVSTPSRDGLQSSTMPRSPFLDSHQSLPQLHPYQSPHMRQYVGSSAPWPSQPPCHLPWVVSPQTSSVNASVQYSALPITEAVQVTPVRDSSVPRALNMPLTPSSASVTAGGSVSVPTGTSVLMEAKRTTALSGKHTSADNKSRKRKKNLMPEELCQTSSVSLPLTEPASAVGKQLATSVATSLPAHPESRSTVGCIFPASSPIAAATHYQVIGGSDMDRRVVFSNETCSRIEQSKLHAEDAAAVAASAVKHCQGIWSQLSIQKSSGLISEVEVKLASAAVAAAAAASVAKAAAAAAKVASDAALQAKLMGDEAMRMSTMEHSVQASETGLPDCGNNLGMVSPASILKGNDKTNSSNSIILAAREAARKRVEAASAATKRAQNFDAVVKAAELAAEAVSQAGIIIAMGEPIPFTLSELAEAGVDGYWRAQQHVASDQVKPNGVCGGENPNVDGSDKGQDRPAKRLNGRQSSKKGTPRSSEEGNMPLKEVASLPVGNHAGSLNGMRWDFVTGEKVLGVPDQNDEHEQHQQVGMLKENKIMEGSDVEVASDESGLPGVWFSAKVLSLKDGKAYVCHNKLLQGSEKLKEWISLEGEGNKAPRIRIAHPVTAMKFEGARKRRRAAMGNYVWSVGDRADAWLRDGWWEGVVTEKSKEDETKLTVQLTAGGESSIVRPWNLRPSLVWKDGQWTEWSRENNSSRHEGDTPQEKRPKLGLREVEVDPKVDVTRREDNPSGIPCNENLNRPEVSRSLVLSEKERIFSVGKGTAEDKSSNALKMKRTGLQKEGSRVVFGVPKPGKKRKFMEVSKHYVADQALKMSEGTDSIKFAKYLMPQGSHGLKSTPKVDMKGKAAVSLKPKVIKSGKAHAISGKSTSEKDNSASSQDSLLNPKASSLHYEKNKHNKLQEAGFFSNTVKAAEGPVLSSSVGLTSDVSSSQKKSSSAVGAEMGTKGKRALSGEKLAEEEKNSNENLGRMNPETIEPRRSNRRIQPTSRLLEGLQSSMIISKIPPVSHDKSVKAQHRSGISSRGNNRGF